MLCTLISQSHWSLLFWPGNDHKKFDSVHQTVLQQKVHVAGYEKVTFLAVLWRALFLSFEANSKYLKGRSAAMSAICCKASLYFQ